MKHISSEHKIYLSLCIILSLCSIVPIWLVKYFPSQNGPGFLYITHMFKEMNNPAYCYSEYFMRHLHYMPYLSFYVLIFCLSHFFSLLVAQKIVLSFIVLAFPLSIFYFLQNIDQKKIIFGFPAYLIIYNFLLMRGYSNFMLATALFFVFLTYWQKVKENLNWKRIFLLNVFLLLVYVSHIIVVSFLILMLIIIQLLENRSFVYIFRHMSKFAIPTLISVAYFIYFTLINSIWQDEKMRIFDWLDKTQDLYLRFLWPYSHAGKILSLIPFLIVLFSIIKKKGDIFSSYLSKNKLSIYNSAENRNIFLLLIIGLIYYLAPWEIVGWHKADVRIIPFIFIFILACGQPFNKERHRITFVLITSIISIIMFIHISQQLMQLDHEIKNEYLSGIDHIQKNKKLLPIIVDKCKYKKINPYSHLFNYYGLYKGSMTGKSLACYNTISPVWYKDYKEFPNFSKFPTFNVFMLNKKNIEAIRDAYDYVLLWGNNNKVESMFLNNGFNLIFENMRLHIFEPDKADMSVRHPASP